jgi:hypothetical protein
MEGIVATLIASLEVRLCESATQTITVNGADEVDRRLLQRPIPIEPFVLWGFAARLLAQNIRRVNDSEAELVLA